MPGRPPRESACKSKMRVSDLRVKFSAGNVHLNAVSRRASTHSRFRCSAVFEFADSFVPLFAFRFHGLFAGEGVALLPIFVFSVSIWFAFNEMKLKIHIVCRTKLKFSSGECDTVIDEIHTHAILFSRERLNSSINAVILYCLSA